MHNNVDVGTILSRMFRVVGDAPVPTAIYTLVLGGLSCIGILLGYLDPVDTNYFSSFGVVLDGSDPSPSVLFELGTLAAGAVGTWLLLREMLRSQGRMRWESGGFWTFIGMSTLAVIAMIFGILLLLVPALVMLVRWSAANGFAVSRGLRPIAALSASWDATRGHSWPIFFAGLVLVVGGGMVFSGLSTAIIAVNDAAGLVIAALLDALANALSFAFSVAIFILVNDDREEMAEVFA